ncbi:MAG: M20/M25/M40 family metallo-hydrolase [Candidatus Aminicenantales bacterium]
MRLRNSIVFRIQVVFLFSILIFSNVPQSSDTLLIKIDKRQKVSPPAQWLAEIQPVQELETCWIAKASSLMVANLQNAGFLLEVLDVNPEGKPYYLVYAPRPERLEELRNFGNVRAVESRVRLFWTGDEGVRDVLPAYFQLKRLPSEIPLPLEIETEAARKEVPGERKFVQRIPFDQRVWMMANQVSTENLRDCIQSLQNFQTRYTSIVNCELSGDYIYNFFSQAGIQSEYDPFSFYPSYSSRNIIGILPGKTAPECIVIVCAHYDSTSDDRNVLAPGADDNGSGTAAVMELARIMTGYSFDFTLKFICFSAEEWGLYGSKHYTQEAKQRGEKIIGVINMDMIGYADILPEDLDIVANSRSEWLADQFIEFAGNYVPLEMRKLINASIIGSDHSPFWDMGYCALLGIEDEPLNNPYYHKTTDTLDKLNMDFVTAVTKASLAAAACLAQPENTPSPPSGVTAHSQISSSLFTDFKTVHINWNPVQGQQITGYNIYRTTTSHANYKKISSLPVSQTSFKDEFLNTNTAFFYVITAVDSEGRESNYSEEVKDDEDNANE